MSLMPVTTQELWSCAKHYNRTDMFVAGVVSFTDPPVLTWHRPIYLSYPAVVSGTLP